jgi:hypothetical protein
MYSNDSSESGDVAVIRQPICSNPNQSYSTYLVDYAKEVCLGNTSKHLICVDNVAEDFVACVRCPPFVIKADEVRTTVVLCSSCDCA